MANISVDWEVDGILTPNESVSAMIKVITNKSRKDSGTFWTWEGKVDFTSKGDETVITNLIHGIGVPVVNQPTKHHTRTQWQTRR